METLVIRAEGEHLAEKTLVIRAEGEHLAEIKSYLNKLNIPFTDRRGRTALQSRICGKDS